MQGKLFKSKNEGMFDPKFYQPGFDLQRDTILRPVVLIPSRNLVLRLNTMPPAFVEIHSRVELVTDYGERSEPTRHMEFVRDVEVPDDLVEDALKLQDAIKRYNEKSGAYLGPLTKEVRCECRTNL